MTTTSSRKLGLLGAFVIGTTGLLGCGSPAGSIDIGKAIGASESAPIHAVMTWSSADLVRVATTELYIDNGGTRSFSREFDQDGELVRVVVIEGAVYREYSPIGDWLIERSFPEEGRPPLNEHRQTLFGYVDPLVQGTVNDVRTGVLDGRPTTEFTFDVTDSEDGAVSIEVALDQDSLLPLRMRVVASEGTGEHLAENRMTAQLDIEYMPPQDAPEFPTIDMGPSTAIERYMELSPEDGKRFNEFTIQVPVDSALERYGSPTVMHLENRTADLRSSAVYVYYFPFELSEYSSGSADLQISQRLSASGSTDEIDNAIEVQLISGESAWWLDEGDGLHRLSFNSQGVSISILAKSQNFDLDALVRIASSMQPYGS